MSGSILSTSHGTNRQAFQLADWGIFASLGLIWGGSFLFMAIGLDAFRPGVVTLLRLGLGSLILVLIPGPKISIDRSDWPRLIVIAAIWMAIPLTLFPIAQQWIDSSVAGMLNGLTPLVAALVASILLRELPVMRQAFGLIAGLIGILMISLPSAGQSSSGALGVVLVVIASSLYGISLNLVTPLQQKYGSLQVMKRMAPVATLMVLPLGVAHLPGSEWSTSSFLAVAVVGVLGTGLAFVLAGILAGRVGGPRTSTVTYLIPVVALILGVVFRNEQVAAIAVVGTGLVILGAGMSSRSDL